MWAFLQVAFMYVSYLYTQIYTNLHKSKEKPMDELHDVFKLFVNLITGPHKAL